MQNLKKANELYSRVRSTDEAALDAKLLVMSADLGLQRSLKVSRMTQSFDINDFLNRVKRFMITTSEAAITQAEANNEADAAVEEEEEDDDDDTLQDVKYWSKLGLLGLKFSKAAPPRLSFLLGSLTAEAKEKVKIQRQARQKLEKGELQEPEEVNYTS